MTSNSPLAAVSAEIMKKLDFYKLLNISEAVATKFFKEIEKMYFPNPYHNSTHGADVLVSAYNIITHSHLRQKMSTLEMFSLVVAGAAHGEFLLS